MHSLLVVDLLPFFSILLHDTAVEAFNMQSVINDLTYFNIPCTDDHCQDNQEDSLSSRACHCGMQCAKLGTCCFDSPYVDVPQPELKPTCGYVSGIGYYFLVDKCPSTDSVWAGLCNNQRNADDYVQERVPVTSLLTYITYKNYYCFRCYEETDEFLYWNLQVKSNHELPTTPVMESKELASNVSVFYDKRDNKILASYDAEGGYISVQLSLQIPSEIMNITYVCEPSVISSCSNIWSDEDVRNKCKSYMALKTVQMRYSGSYQFKNVHCALCNYVKLTDVYCRVHGYGYGYGGYNPLGYGYSAYAGGASAGAGGSQGFMYTYFIDINRSDGDLVGKIKKCSDNNIWDGFAKKCRKLVCAIPGYKVKNWKCVKK